MVNVIIVAAAPTAAGPAAAVVFIPQLPPIVSDDPLGMRGLHTAVCSAAPTGWLSTQVFFSVTYVACCIECSLAPPVAAPQTGFSVTCVKVLHTWRPIFDCIRLRPSLVMEQHTWRALKHRPLPRTRWPEYVRRSYMENDQPGHDGTPLQLRPSPFADVPPNTAGATISRASTSGPTTSASPCLSLGLLTPSAGCRGPLSGNSSLGLLHDPLDPTPAVA